MKDLVCQKVIPGTVEKICKLKYQWTVNNKLNVSPNHRQYFRLYFLWLVNIFWEVGITLGGLGFMTSVFPSHLARVLLNVHKNWEET